MPVLVRRRASNSSSGGGPSGPDLSALKLGTWDSGMSLNLVDLTTYDNLSAWRGTPNHCYGAFAGYSGWASWAAYGLGGGTYVWDGTPTGFVQNTTLHPLLIRGDSVALCVNPWESTTDSGIIYTMPEAANGDYDTNYYNLGRRTSGTGQLAASDYAGGYRADTGNQFYPGTFYVEFAREMLNRIYKWAVNGATTGNPNFGNRELVLQNFAGMCEHFVNSFWAGFDSNYSSSTRALEGRKKVRLLIAPETSMDKKKGVVYYTTDKDAAGNSMQTILWDELWPRIKHLFWGVAFDDYDDHGWYDTPGVVIGGTRLYYKTGTTQNRLDIRKAVMGRKMDPTYWGVQGMLDYCYEQRVPVAIREWGVWQRPTTAQYQGGGDDNPHYFTGIDGIPGMYSVMKAQSQKWFYHFKTGEPTKAFVYDWLMNTNASDGNHRLDNADGQARFPDAGAAYKSITWGK